MLDVFGVFGGDAFEGVIGFVPGGETTSGDFSNSATRWLVASF